MGAGVSRSSNILDSSMKSAINTSMDSKVSGEVNVACQNVQEVVGVSNCSIQFAPQVCEVSGIANVTTNSTLVSETTQEVYSAIKQAAESSVSGLNVGVQISNASNFARSMMDVATSTTQAFATDCSKNASAVNVQSVRDTTCDDVTRINFAAQNSSAKVMGDCAVTVSGQSKAYNKVTSVMDQTATATVKGVDPFAFILALLLPFLLLLLMPLGIGALKSSLGAALTGDPKSEQRAKIIDIAGTLINVALVYAAVVWPGIAAYMFGVAPYQPPMPGTDDVCLKDTYVGEDTFVNKFMFYDPTCATAPKDKTCEKTRHYAGCGVFSGLCPAATADIERYTAAAEACSSLRGLVAEEGKSGKTTKGAQYCRAQDIAALVFAQDVKYKGCSLCSDPGSPLWHSWVREGADCSAKTDPLVYKRTDLSPCEAGDELGYCMDSDDALKARSPDDCLDNGYQERKRVFSKLLRACKRVEATTVVPARTDGSPRPLRLMCEPKVFDYMKCNATTKECAYAPPSGAAAPVVAACANSFEGCEDPEYLADRKVWEALNANCKARWDAVASRNYWFVAVSAGVYAVLLLLLVGVVVNFWSQPAPDPAVMALQAGVNPAAAAVAASPIWYGMVIPGVLVLLLVVGGLLVALGEGLWPWSEEQIAKWDSLDQSTASTIGYVVLAGAGLALLAYGVWYFRARSRPQTANSASSVT
jgi:hypothetical protein